MRSLPTRTWWAVAGTSTLVLIAGVFLGYRTAPGLGDPLARPAQLAAGIVASAGAIETETAFLVERQRELGQPVGALDAMVVALDRLEAQTGALGGLVESLNARTQGVAAVANGLPPRLAVLNRPATRGTVAAQRLQTDISALSGELDRVVAALAAMGSDTEALVPRATAVANHLEDIGRDTALLGQLRRLLAGLGIR